LIHVNSNAAMGAILQWMHRVSAMKTILVPVGGSDTDQIVFETALAVAHPLMAHLEFLHIRVDAVEAALHTPHLEFARGAALRNALHDLGQEAERRAARATRSVRDFCTRYRVNMVDKPCEAEAVTARWRQEQGDALERLMFHSRRNDLVVMGRATTSDGLPKDRLESLLMGCGRPLLIASASAPKSLLGTVMVCWNETANAARAVLAAMPLLSKAKHVILVNVRKAAGPGHVADIVRQLKWHSIDADARIVPSDGSSTAELLSATARDCRADLLIMGGYSRWPIREMLFGGCTRTMLGSAETPVFLLH
jgi:nucleotide-binding universal stress UspA family protein